MSSSDRREFLHRAGTTLGGLILPGSPAAAFRSAPSGAGLPLLPDLDLELQRMLDPLCLVGVDINPEMRVKAVGGPAPALLKVRGRQSFLMKVHNQAGTTAELRARCNAGWLDVETAWRPPLSRTLSGQKLEYRILRLRSHEAGWREATLVFDVGQGSQDLGFRNEVPILFDCRLAGGPGAAQVYLSPWTE